MHDGWNPGEDISHETPRWGFAPDDDFPNALGMAILIGASCAVVWVLLIVGLYLMFT